VWICIASSKRRRWGSIAGLDGGILRLTSAFVFRARSICDLVEVGADARQTAESFIFGFSLRDEIQSGLTCRSRETGPGSTPWKRTVDHVFSARAGHALLVYWCIGG